MNKKKLRALELEQALKVFGITNPISYGEAIILGKGKNLEYLLKSSVLSIEETKTYVWQSFVINIYEKLGYMDIEGKIPVEVANIIYEKYLERGINDSYGIIVLGKTNEHPNKYCIDDKFEEDVRKLNRQNLSTHKLYVECQKARKELLHRSSENKYITNYRVTKKEGLAIFLLEMKDYLARKQGLAETEVQRFDERMNDINIEILKKVNSIPAYEWMEDSESFLVAMKNSRKTHFAERFRSALNEFDQVVNPFENTNIELDKPTNYLSKVDIKWEPFIWKDDILCNNYKLCIGEVTSENEEKNEVRCYRNPETIEYALKYETNGEKKLLVHSCDSQGENVTIDFDNGFFIEYNVSKDTVHNSYNNWRIRSEGKISHDQEVWIYHELLKAIYIASTITIDNMQKERQKTKHK